MQLTSPVRRQPRLVKRLFSKSQTLLQVAHFGSDNTTPVEQKSINCCFPRSCDYTGCEAIQHKEINQVNRSFMIVLAAAAAAFFLHAQSANPLSTEVKQAYANTKNKVIKAAEKMPDENYSFKATPDVRTFGAWIAHVADAQVRNCAT